MAQQLGLWSSGSSSTSNNRNHSYYIQDKSLLQDLASFSVVVAGEYNAGKSTLINALTGTKLLETGALPTTDTITLITHDNHSDNNDDDSILEHLANMPGILHHSVSNLPLLQDLTLVDTPGTNAVLRNHTATTMALLPNADLILFVTAADRPFSESERNLLQSICHYRKSIVVIINKMDVLEQTGGLHGATEKQRVVDFVTEHASELLGARPIVIPVSSRDALAAKLMGKVSDDNKSTWQRSNFAVLESFLRDSLTTETKIKAKLTSPIGVAEGWLQDCRVAIARERDHLKADVTTLTLLQSQLTAWRRDVTAELAEAAHQLHQRTVQESQRGVVLLRRWSVWDVYAGALGSVFSDRNNSTAVTPLQAAWNKTKPTFAAPSITVQTELLVMTEATAESVATRGRAQAQTVIEFLGQRPMQSRNGSSLVGSVTAASRFEETRQQLAEHLQQAIQRHWADWDERQAEQTLLAMLQQAAWMSFGLNVGALGTILLAATTSVLDFVTAALAASALTASSALVVTTGRQQIVQRQHVDRWTRRSDCLMEDIQVIHEQHVERLDRRIRDGVSPYTRWVEVEQERLQSLAEQCDRLTVQAQRLRQRIRDL